MFTFDPEDDGSDAVSRFIQHGSAKRPASALCPIYIRRAALDVMVKEARDARPLEAMGLLVGTLYNWHGTVYAVARDAVTGEREATETTVRFAMERGRLLEALDSLRYPYVIVGWWHSHPGYSCFLSETDVETQARMFPEAHHRAIVVDPVANDMKAFGIDPESGVFESAFAISDDREVQG
jgi:proteasome lid subunit RPN8/RPN11